MAGHARGCAAAADSHTLPGASTIPCLFQVSRDRKSCSKGAPCAPFPSEIVITSLSDPLGLCASQQCFCGKACQPGPSLACPCAHIADALYHADLCVCCTLMFLDLSHAYFINLNPSHSAGKGGRRVRAEGGHCEAAERGGS